MSYTLVKLDSNYADEFGVEAFVVVESNLVPKFMELASAQKKSFDIGFGTNEELQFCDGEDFLSQITFKELTDTETAFFKEFFGKSYLSEGTIAEFGLCTYFFDYIMDNEELDDDEEDDE